MVAPEQIERRIQALRRGLADAGLDAAVIVQNADLAYFSGTNQQAHLIVPAEGDPLLAVRRTLARAQAESPLAAQPLRSLSGLTDALAGAGVEPGARLGFELDVLPAASFLAYRDRLAGYEIADCSRGRAGGAGGQERVGHRAHAGGGSPGGRGGPRGAGPSWPPEPVNLRFN